MLRQSYFPLIWTFSTVILILILIKLKTSHLLYRPILPKIAKLFKQIILKRIRPIMQTHNKIPNYQMLKPKFSNVPNVLCINLLQPIWAYSIQILGCAKLLKMFTIEAFQSITLFDNHYTLVCIYVHTTF